MVDFLKRQMFLIICGVVALAGIGLGIMGMSKMSEVADGVQEAAELAAKLPALRRGTDGPINGKAIDAQHARIKDVQAFHKQVLDWAHQRNLFKPLLDDSFPDPDRDRKIAFREAYKVRFTELRKQLRAGQVASPDEINDAQVLIQEEAKADRAFGIDQSEAGAAEAASDDDAQKPLQYPSGLLTDHGAMTDPAARANLIKARSMYCYATAATFETFNLDVGIAPDVNDMWDAQVSLWLQESVIQALTRVNDQAAKTLRDAGHSPWVGLLPIKEVVSIRTSPYIIDGAESTGFSSPTGDGPATPPSSAAETFSHTVSNDLYEVVQFTVKLVVDVRQMPHIIEALCQDNFHTLLRLVYEDVNGEETTLLMNGKIYGSQPTVRVVLDFETVFFGELYRDIMPDGVRGALGLPDREDAD